MIKGRGTDPRGRRSGPRKHIGFSGDPLTRQLRSQKAIRSSAFDPSAVRRRHNTGRITATALNALFQHAEIVEANDDYKAIARKFVDKSTKMIPTVAKNLAAEDLISVV